MIKLKNILNEAKTFKPGDMWSKNFDYKGMLKWGSKVKEPNGVKEFDDMKKAARSFEDVNYHTEAKHLFAAIEAVSAVNPPTWGPPSDKHLKAFNKSCLKTLKDFKRISESRIINERMAKDVFQDATNALTKTTGGRKFDKRYVKDYLKNIERMARKNPGTFVKDYGDFKVGDWLEDVRYNMANESKRSKIMEKIKTLTPEQKTKLKEKLVFYRDKKDRLRRFDTDDSKNKKYKK